MAAKGSGEDLQRLAAGTDMRNGSGLKSNSDQDRFMTYLRKIKNENSTKGTSLSSDIELTNSHEEFNFHSSVDGDFGSEGSPSSGMHKNYERRLKANHVTTRGFIAETLLPRDKLKDSHLRIQNHLVGETAEGDRVERFRGLGVSAAEANLPPEDRAKIRTKRGDWEGELLTRRIKLRGDSAGGEETKPEAQITVGSRQKAFEAIEANLPPEDRAKIRTKRGDREGELLTARTKLRGESSGGEETKPEAQIKVGSKQKALAAIEANPPPEDRAKLRMKRGAVWKREEELEKTIRNDILAARAKLWKTSLGGAEGKALTKAQVDSRKTAQNATTAHLPIDRLEELRGTNQIFVQDQEEGGGSGYQDQNPVGQGTISKLSHEPLAKRKNKRKVHSVDENKIFGDTTDGLEGETEGSGDDISGQNLSLVTEQKANKLEASITGESRNTRAMEEDEHRETGSFKLEDVLKDISDVSPSGEEQHTDSIAELENFFSVANRKGESKGSRGTGSTGKSARENFEMDGERASDDDYDNAHGATYQAEEESEKQEDEEEMGDDDFDSIHREGTTNQTPAVQSNLEQDHSKVPTEGKLNGKGDESKTNDEDEENEAQEIEKLQEFLGRGESFLPKSDPTAGSGPDTYGHLSGNGDEDGEAQELRDSTTRRNGNYRMGSNRQVSDTETRESNAAGNGTQEKGIMSRGKGRNESHEKVNNNLRNSTKADGCTTQEIKERHGKIITDLENYINYEKCTAEDTQERRRRITAQLEDFMSCIAEENSNNQQKNIIDDLEHFMDNGKCTDEGSRDRQGKIVADIENFTNFIAQESRERQRKITRHLERFMKQGTNQAGRRKIMADLEQLMEDRNCTTEGNHGRRRKIMTDLENFMTDGSCLDQRNESRQKAIMADLEQFMKSDICDTQENPERQRQIITDLETFIKDSCADQQSVQTNNTRWLKKVPGRAVSNPIVLPDIRNMEQKLLQAQREANGDLNELGFEMKKKLSGLETNLRVVTQLANAMDRKMADAAENAFRLSKDASLKAKSKLFQVKQAASAVDVIEQKVGIEHTVNVSRNLLYRLHDNPSFKMNKIYQQLLAVNGLIAKLEGAKILAHSRAEKAFKEEEKTAKVTESEAESIRTQLALAVVEIDRSTAQELREEREAMEKIRQAERRNALAYQKASQAMSRVEKYLAKLQKDEVELSKF